MVMRLQELGPRLRQARKENLGVSLRKAADGLPIGHAQLGQIENGKPTTTETLQVVADSLGLHIEVMVLPSQLTPMQAELLETFTKALAHIDDRDARLILSQLKILGS